MCWYCHLHVHTDASKDGLGRVEDLVKLAHSMGYKSLAMTDHGTLSNTVRFYQACNKAGIKPIIGLEGYIEVDNKRGHITLLSDGDKGYSSLVKLHNVAHAKSESYKDMATFNVEELLRYNEGLICLTGCVASPLHQLSLNEALSLGQRLKNVFDDRLFAEIMHVGDSNDIWLRSLELADNLGLKLVATNDVHFQKKEHADLHPILTRMKASYDYNSRELYLKSELEMIERGKKLGVRNFEDAVYNAGWLAEKLESPHLKKPQKLPEVPHASETLREMVFTGLGGLGLNGSEYIERANYELNNIDEKEFSDYFVILNDMVQHARDFGTKVNVRGSAAGSLVLYALGISRFDPLIYNLSFERFLNPLRKGLPDVDLDLESEGREELFQYASRKYGAKPIAAYQVLTPKTLTHKLASQFLYSREIENAAASGGVTSPEYKQLEATFPLFKLAIEVMSNQNFGMGQHAAGMIIPPNDDYPVPLVRTNRGYLATAFTEASNGAEELKEIGLVKFDMLGVNALTPIFNLEKRYGMKAPLPHETSDADKQLMLDAIKNNRVHGLFQFTSSEGHQLLKMCMKDATIGNMFERMVIATTINRPAVPIDLKNKFDALLKTPRKLHPSIDDVIYETGGIMIYQEQMMRVYGILTGGGDADADEVRRAITKIKGVDGESLDLAEKKNGTYVSSLPHIAPLKEKLMNNGKSIHGIDEDLLEVIWSEIVSSAGYGFNRSHAVCYMGLAWEQLWWFIKKPVALYAEWCNIENDKADVFEHLFYAASIGITIHPPNINYSSDKYEYDDNNIYVPLTQIAGLSSGASQIVNERETNGKFTSYADFRARVAPRACNNSVCRKIEELGGFAGLSGSFDDFKIKYKPDDKQVDRTKSISNAQMEHLKFVIPTTALIEKMKRLKLGWKGGIVTKIEIKNKNNGKGDYGLIYFVPNDNMCVCRPIPTDVNIGDILFYKDVGFGIKKEFRRFDANDKT